MTVLCCYVTIIKIVVANCPALSQIIRSKKTTRYDEIMKEAPMVIAASALKQEVFEIDENLSLYFHLVPCFLRHRTVAVLASIQLGPPTLIDLHQLSSKQSTSIFTQTYDQVPLFVSYSEH